MPALYMLTPNPDLIYMPPDLWIPRESRLWPDYEAWLAEGNTPDPWQPTVYPIVSTPEQDA